MRKLIKIGLVVLGIRLFLLWRKGRQAESESEAWPSPPDSTGDPADELRRKLAAARDDVAAGDAPTTPESSVADRRAEVHEQGRAALDEMKPSDES